MSVDLTSEQHQALDQIDSFMREPLDELHPHFYLGGYAGTGKSTLVRHILNNMTAEERFATVIMTPTGKAADVLRKKGIPDACTVHSAIYSPFSPSDLRIEELRIRLKQMAWQDAQEKADWESELGDLVKDGAAFSMGKHEFLEGKKYFICDEFSMVGSRMYSDIISLGKKLLAIGDPGQLPPVKDQEPPFNPDFVLQTVHRQALDNPIIRMAHMVRNGEKLQPGMYGESRVIGPDQYDRSMLMNCDQVISYTHQIRKHVNRLVRLEKGYDVKGQHVYPQTGEKLVCRKNQTDKRLFNGAMYSAASNTKDAYGSHFCSIDNGVEVLDLELYPMIFQEYVRKVEGHEHMSYNERRDFSEFDFGYAITGHSSQGSEWDDVLVCDETWKMKNPKERTKWLYTSLTRASKRVTVYQTKEEN